MADIINNTGHSRQVSRAREREFDKAHLSPSLEAALDARQPGQGLFMRFSRWGAHYSPGWPSETRPPRIDNSHKYAHLFKETTK